MRAPLPAGCYGEERTCSISGLSKPGSAHSAQKHGFLRRNRQHVGPRPPLAPASSVHRLPKTVSTSHCRRRGPQTIAAHARGDDRLHTGGGAVGLFRELKDAVTAKINQMDGLWDRFWPMTVLFCLMTFVNTLIDSLKDTLVITATNGGPEVIPWLTVYAVFPFSVLFLFVYASASQRHSRGALFNSIIAVFLSFFAVFGFILYPAHEQLHAVAFADAVEAVVPVGFAGLIGMVRNWTFTLFYCVSELWGDVGLSLLFWGLANDTTSMKHAPLLYPVFGIGANIAQILAGQVLSAAPRLTHGAFAKQLQFIMGLVLCVGVLILCLHRHIEGQAKERQRRKRVLATRSRPPQVVSAVAASTQTPVNGRHANGANSKARSNAVEAMSSNGSDANGHLHDAHVLSCSSMVLSSDPTVSLDEAEEELHRSEVAGKAKKKPKVSIGQAIGMVMKQRSVRDLAVMAVAQGLCSSLMEFSWKSHLRIMLPTPSAYSKFMVRILQREAEQAGEVATTTGMVTVGLMMASPLLFDRYGWGTVAGATPRLLMVVGTLFFLGTVVYQVLVERGMALLVQHQLLYGLSIAGALLYVMSRSAKFSLFKPAEEMVYISLNEDARTKGKAAVDVVGAQMGKSSASLMQQVLLLITAGSLLHCLPVMTVVFFGMATCWLSSVQDIARSHHPQKQAPGDDALLDDNAFWEPPDEGHRHRQTDGGPGRGLGDAVMVEGAC